MTKIKRSFLERLTGAKTIESGEDYADESSIRPTNNFYQEETEISMNSSFNSNPQKNMNEENICCPKFDPIGSLLLYLLWVQSIVQQSHNFHHVFVIRQSYKFYFQILNR